MPGKSSLALALLRGIPTSGEVLYDGKDTAKLNLDSLRSSITLIPQHPEVRQHLIFLFFPLYSRSSQLLAGSLRENIDPFSQHDDATLNDALRSAGLYDLSSSRAASTSDLSATAEGSDGQESESIRSGPRNITITLDTQIEAGGANFSLGQRPVTLFVCLIAPADSGLLCPDKL